MAVSESVRKAFHSKPADKAAYPRDFEEAEAIAAGWKASGIYRRVQVYSFNNGSRLHPIPAPVVRGWLK